MTTQLPITESQQTSDLYEEDYHLWLMNTIHQLQHGKLAEVDMINLIEELEAMGRSQKSAIESNLRILLMHLLKYKYQSDKRTNSWLFTIREHRKRLRNDFKNSPSLKRYFLEVFPECYQDARELAADETGLSINTFPIESPFSQEDTLNPDYLPE
ncbi:hypothetical protein PA905_48450 [Planktothrix agardhii CCAP 1459/11A]|jgi:hypothetical protein|uniref:DUF29 domain-containing protein n=1 Tax=Planktothrix agardhii CCAP 1459/11A TaxID=282420 RepID=A0A479ZXY8_PLAAG|nr:MULTISPECIES: DUF29 domain-containing protein [Planktothrix]CAD5922552.1 hypothetical protein NO108_01136 [Planktothrix rubescens]CAD5944404.1 hypothetical protein NO365_02132 [Planktothrix agardhii]CAD5945973.1 hypothetical protein NO758_02223 [Planktothrix agardhii]CAH2572679.1 hypothetical protein PRNO82_02086 [Planktothrix rubescens]GCL34714.1 hypothetical protein PA905_48450 [Planktothrix agardhii CCAP 1459/11A]